MKCCKILGVHIAITNMNETVKYIEDNISTLKGKYITVCNGHTSVMAYEDRKYRNVQNKAILSLPDGEPLSIVSRLRGYKEAQRVTGPDLMEEMFRKGQAGDGLHHYFYGGTQETLDNLKEVLESKYPKLQIVGMYSPPFRKLTKEEKQEDIRRINASKADIIWVGLGAPKQENWMYEHRGMLCGVSIGVGAGFDYHAGKLKRAPKWMQKISMEWFVRLLQDPKRLWKRYLVTNTKFICYAIKESVQLKRKSDKIEINGKMVPVLEYHKTNSKYQTDKQQVFIIGSKGIPAAYGGFETFVEKLTEKQVSDKIRYHVSRMGKDNKRYKYHRAKCFNIRVPEIGSAKAVYYDIKALKYCIEYCKVRPAIEQPVFYVLACRIGPFMGYFKKKIRKLGGTLYINPDGHEWKRSKWSLPVRWYWKISERLMVKHADLIICDSKNIEKYIKEDYRKYNPETMYIAYGTETMPSNLKDDDAVFQKWLSDRGLQEKDYYLIVGRFVSENNFETMIREFMKSKTKRDLAIVTTANDAFLEELEQKLHFKQDKRIKFAGTVYEEELLKKIRENAYAYLHGHEVGGTNPSLLEALSFTKVSLLHDVGFNREVAEDAAYYWNKKEGNLAALIDSVECMSEDERRQMEEKAKARISKAYSWKYIVEQYEELFSSNLEEERG